MCRIFNRCVHRIMCGLARITSDDILHDWICGERLALLENSMNPTFIFFTICIAAILVCGYFEHKRQRKIDKELKHED